MGQSEERTMNSKRKGQRPRHGRIGDLRRNAKPGGAKGRKGNTAGQTKARTTRRPSRRSDSSKTDDPLSKLIAQALSAEPGSAAADEAREKIGRHVRRHQSLPKAATWERQEAQRLLVAAEREQKAKTVYLLVGKLKDEGIELAQRVELINEAISPILLDTELAQQVLPAMSESLRRADPRGWRAFVEHFLHYGMAFAATGPDTSAAMEGTVAAMLRGVLAEEFRLSSASELLVLDELLSQWITVSRLRRRAETAYRAGGERAMRDYTRLVESAVKATQGLTALMGDLSANNQSPVRVIAVEEVEPPILEQDAESDQDAPAAESA